MALSCRQKHSRSLLFLIWDISYCTEDNSFWRGSGVKLNSVCYCCQIYPRDSQQPESNKFFFQVNLLSNDLFRPRKWLLFDMMQGKREDLIVSHFTESKTFHMKKLAIWFNIIYKSQGSNTTEAVTISSLSKKLIILSHFENKNVHYFLVPAQWIVVSAAFL